MKKSEMSKLIVDHVMLVYLHDLLSLREKDDFFYDRDVYHVLMEPHLATVILGFQKSILSTISFIALVSFIKMSYLSLPLFWQIVSIVLILMHYGVTFFFFQRERKEVQYQFQLKKAAHFALEHFNYDEFVIFIDQYLSVKSSSVYYEGKVSHNI